MIRTYIIVILAFCSFVSEGQNILNSPYSRFGLGDIHERDYMSIRQMGGLGNSWLGSNQINSVNPASLPYLVSTAYEVGVDASNVSLSDGTNETNQWGGKFNYLGIAFPLFNPINDIFEDKVRKLKFGMGFNLTRNSTVGYNITSVDSTDQLGVYTRNYKGDGGTYEFAWSNGVKYKEYSFGVKLGYLFGNTSYGRTVVFNEKEYSFSDVFEDSYFIKAFTYSFGLIYSRTLGDKEKVSLDKLGKITLGVRYDGGSKFRAVGDKTAYGEQLISGSGIIRDTVLYQLDTSASGFIPGTFGLGVNYVKGNKWGVGVDWSTSAWSNYYHELKGEVKNELRNSMSVSFGGFYRPDYKSYNNYLKRMTYRMGFYYKQDPREVEGKGIDQYGITMGLGLPFNFQRKGSRASLGVDIGQRGSGTVIEENYIKINFGFTFNDEGWFIKRKYN